MVGDQSQAGYRFQPCRPHGGGSIMLLCLSGASFRMIIGGEGLI